MWTAKQGSRLSHVVAVAQRGVIGSAGGLPWHVPEDLRLFKTLTSGHALIMGRKTFASIGKPLPGRLSIVVTRDPTQVAVHPQVQAVSSMAAAFAAAEAARPMWGDEVFVIGGGELFAATMAAASRLYVTRLDLEVAGDTHYPAISPDFSLVHQESYPAARVPFTWEVWERAPSQFSV